MEDEGSGSVQIIRYPDPDPGGQKHTNPTDPDPQHCYKHLPIALVGDVNLLVRLVNDLRERKYRNKEVNKKAIRLSNSLPRRVYEGYQHTWQWALL